MKLFNNTELKQAYKIVNEWTNNLQKEAEENERICNEFEISISEPLSEPFDYLSSTYLLLSHNHIKEMTRDMMILLSLCHKINENPETPLTEQNKMLNRFFESKKEYQSKWSHWIEERLDLMAYLQNVS